MRLTIIKTDKGWRARQGPIACLGRTEKEAVKNLHNYSIICSYGHDHVMAFCLPYDEGFSARLEKGAKDRAFADEYTLNWLKRTGQLDKRSSL